MEIYISNKYQTAYWYQPMQGKMHSSEEIQAINLD